MHQRTGKIREKYNRVTELNKIGVPPDDTSKKAEIISWQMIPQKESKTLTGIYRDASHKSGYFFKLG